MAPGEEPERRNFADASRWAGGSLLFPAAAPVSGVAIHLRVMATTCGLKMND